MIFRQPPNIIAPFEVRTPEGIVYAVDEQGIIHSTGIQFQDGTILTSALVKNIDEGTF